MLFTSYLKSSYRIDILRIIPYTVSKEESFWSVLPLLTGSVVGDVDWSLENPPIDQRSTTAFLPMTVT